MDEIGRDRVVRRRREYGCIYAEQIARLVDDAPLPTARQLAHLRRVFRARRGAR